MDSIRVRKFSGAASIVIGVLLAGSFFVSNDWVTGVVGIFVALIGAATLYDLHTTS